MKININMSCIMPNLIKQIPPNSINIRHSSLNGTINKIRTLHLQESTHLCLKKKDTELEFHNLNVYNAIHFPVWSNMKPIIVIEQKNILISNESVSHALRAGLSNCRILHLCKGPIWRTPSKQYV